MKINQMAFERVLCLIIQLSFVPAIYSQSPESDVLFSHGVECYNSGNYKEALSFFEKANTLDEQQIPVESNRYGYCLEWMSSCYYKLGEIEKAISISYNFFNLIPTDRRLTVESDNLLNMADIAEKSGNIDNAIDYLEKANKLEKEYLGETSMNAIVSYRHIGNLYYNKRDFYNALRYYNYGLDAIHKANLKNNIYEFYILQGLSDVYLQRNDLEKAYIYSELMLDIAKFHSENYGNRQMRDVAYLKHAKLELMLGNNDKANALAVKTFNSIIENYNPEVEDIVEWLDYCLITIDMTMRIDEIHSFIQKAIDKIENTQSPNQSHIGFLSYYMGKSSPDYETSKRWLLKSIELLKDSKYVGIYNSAVNLLASCCESMGNVREALSYLENLRKEYAADKSNLTYLSLGVHIADILTEMGSLEDALKMYEETLSHHNDGNSPYYTLTYIKWLTTYLKYLNAFVEENEYDIQKLTQINNEMMRISDNLNLKDFVSAGMGIPTVVPVFLEFIRIYLHSVGDDDFFHLQQIESMLTECNEELLSQFVFSNQIKSDVTSLLASVKFRSKKYDESIELINEMIAELKSHGIPCDGYIHDLAYYQYEKGDIEHTIENFENGFEFLKEEVLSHYKWMTQSERYEYTNYMRGNLDYLPKFAAFNPKNARFARLAYNALLFTKGMLLNSSIEFSTFIRESGNNEALKLLNEWRTKCQQYQMAINNGNWDVKYLKDERDALEKRLMGMTENIGDYTSRLLVDCDAVMDALSENDLAIEFFSFKNDSAENEYGAIIIGHNIQPKYVSVGCEKNWIDKIVDFNCYMEPTLFNEIFSELKQYLPNKTQGDIYFSPDGIFHSVAIENICGSEEYNFKRLTSTREIARKTAHNEFPGQMAVFGGVSYGLGNLKDLYEEDSDSTNNRESSDFLDSLPATLTEAQNINELMKDWVNVEMFLRDKANEESFKSLSGSNINYLHIATHGFYTEKQSKNTYNISDDNMEASGLYLAGAQNSLWNEPCEGMAEDGILNSKEISQMDFRNLDLVVLSACNTGNGLISKDGVWGLQRGFKQAGAKSILMSLWKVDDNATQELMTSFYENIKTSESLYEALNRAKNTIRLQYPDPRYWAPFILVDANK